MRGSGGSRASCFIAFLQRCARRLRARPRQSLRIGFLGLRNFTRNSTRATRKKRDMPVSSSELYAGRARKKGTCLFPVPNSTRAGPEKKGHACFQFRTLRWASTWCLSPVPRPKKAGRSVSSQGSPLDPSLHNDPSLHYDPSLRYDPSRTWACFFRSVSPL